jgi:hypothetical protein
VYTIHSHNESTTPKGGEIRLQPENRTIGYYRPSESWKAGDLQNKKVLGFIRMATMAGDNLIIGTYHHKENKTFLYALPITEAMKDSPDGCCAPTILLLEDPFLRPGLLWPATREAVPSQEKQVIPPNSFRQEGPTWFFPTISNASGLYFDFYPDRITQKSYFADSAA